MPEQDYDQLERVYENKQEAQQMLITAIRKEQQSFLADREIIKLKQNAQRH